MTLSIVLLNFWFTNFLRDRDFRFFFSFGKQESNRRYGKAKMLSIKRRRQLNTFNNNDLFVNNNNSNNNNNTAATKQFNDLCSAKLFCSQHKNCSGTSEEVCFHRTFTFSTLFPFIFFFFVFLVVFAGHFSTKCRRTFRCDACPHHTAHLLALLHICYT